MTVTVQLAGRPLAQKGATEVTLTFTKNNLDRKIKKAIESMFSTVDIEQNPSPTIESRRPPIHRHRLHPWEHNDGQENHQAAPDLGQATWNNSPGKKTTYNTRLTTCTRAELKTTPTKHCVTTSMYKRSSGASPPPSPAGHAGRKGSGLARICTRDSQLL
jgi:hypothetical protein